MKSSEDNHPDNKKLERGSGEDYSPVNNGRGCTDFLFLVLLVASWVAMTGVGLAAVGVIESSHIKKGDPERLVNGMDYHGNICGVTNFITPSGADVINLPKAYPMPSGLSVCVESCPETNNFDKFFCEYEIEQTIEDTIGISQLADNSTSTDSARKSLYLFYTMSKQCMPQVESVSFLGYCVPNVPLENILLTSSDGGRENSTSSNETTSEVSISIETESTNNEFFDMAMADAHTVRYVIFSFGCGMAMLLGIVFLIIIQIPGILSLLVWSMIFAVDVGLIGGGMYTKDVSMRWASGVRPGTEAVALYYLSYVLYGLAALWALLICFLRKRIVLAISCVREASKAISSMPIITLFPVAQVLGLVAFTVVWGIYMAFLASSGEIEASCFCPATVDYDFLGNTTTSSVVESNNSGGCDDGCFMYKQLTYSTNTKYAALWMLFCWFWTSQFIVAVGQLVVSLSVSLWYFSRNRKHVGNVTFLRAVFLVSLYHLGTAAFGSLIIAIIKTIRAILTYIEKKAARSKKKVVVVLLKMLKCLLWCIEKCMKFINKQAYIQTAIFGYSFCKASRMAFFLILRNALRISAVSIVSQFVLLIGKIFITVASTVIGYYYLEVNFGDQLNYLMVPTLLIALMAYAVSEMFNEVFGMAIGTILQAFCCDEEMFDVEERFAPSSLAGTIDSTQKKSIKRSRINPWGRKSSSSH